MIKIDKTGQSCVGELRLSKRDIGYDLKLHKIVTHVPETFNSVGLDIDGRTYLISGTKDEMVEEMYKAGYTLVL